MIVRRLVALLTSVTMLHLSLVAGDSACASHGADGHHAAPANAGTTADHAMPMDGHVMPTAAVKTQPAINAAPTAKADTSPCEVPIQVQCCVALVGCSAPGMIAGAHHGLASAGRLAARISDARHDAPPSFTPAPEPPPPKA